MKYYIRIQMLGPISVLKTLFNLCGKYRLSDCDLSKDIHLYFNGTIRKCGNMVNGYIWDEQLNLMSCRHAVFKKGPFLAIHSLILFKLPNLLTYFY